MADAFCGDGFTLLESASRNLLPLVMKGGKIEDSKDPPQDKPHDVSPHLIPSKLARIFFVPIPFVSPLARIILARSSAISSIPVSVSVSAISGAIPGAISGAISGSYRLHVAATDASRRGITVSVTTRAAAISAGSIII
jgi:hypothetical protein